MAQLYLNSLELTLAKTKLQVEVVTCPSTLKPDQVERLKRSSIRLSEEYDGLLWRDFPELSSCDEAYFVNWELEVEDFAPGLPTITLEIDLTRHTRLARAWMVRQLVRHFRQRGCPCERDFIGRVVVYDQVEDGPRSCTYQKYALNPRFHDQCDGWQLDVMPLGKSVVGKVPTTRVDLHGKRCHVIAGTGIFPKEHVPEHIWQSCRGVFYPIVNRGIEQQVGCSPKRRYDSNKYATKNKLLNQFVQTRLGEATLHEIMLVQPITMNSRIRVREGQIGAVDNSAKMLTFGNGQSNMFTRSSFSKHGCFRKPASEATFFFIYPNDKSEKVKALHQLLNKGDADNCVPALANLQYQHPNWEKGLSIAYDPSDMSLEGIMQKLNGERFACGKKFVAIVITPNQEDKATEKEREFYYKLKMELLRKGIVSQMISVGTIGGNDFKYPYINIAAAIIAKQGGLPWGLSSPIRSTDLVVGVGAYRQKDKKNPYLGSAVYFDCDGGLYQFDCCRAKDLEALRHSITKAILEFVNHAKQAPKRLVIHYYKTMSRKESREIEQALCELKLKCPVYVMTVVTATEDDLVAFDMGAGKLMPMSGTYIKLRRSEYLLYCNERFAADDSRCNKVAFPIKLTIKRGNTTQDTIETDVIERDIITQTYQFCRLYYRDVTTQNRPITIVYPALVAKFVSNSGDDELPEEGKTGLWMM